MSAFGLDDTDEQFSLLYFNLLLTPSMFTAEIDILIKIY